MARSTPVSTFHIALTIGSRVGAPCSMSIRIADLGIPVRANRFKSMEAAKAAAIALMNEYDTHVASKIAALADGLPPIHVSEIHFHAIEVAAGAKRNRHGGDVRVMRSDIVSTARVAVSTKVRD